MEGPGCSPALPAALLKAVPRGEKSRLDILSVLNLQHLVAVMVDDRDGDLASLRRVEGAAGGGIKLVAITIGVLPTVGSLIVGGKPPVRGALTVMATSCGRGSADLICRSAVLSRIPTKEPQT